jgi:phage terminase large subunit
LEASYTGVFARQEIDAEFVSAEGLVYSEFRRDIHVRDPAGKIFVRVVAGVDFGFTNPSVILVCGVDSDGRLWVIDEFYERRVLPAVLVDVARSMMNRYGISCFYCDPSEPGFIAMMQEAGLPAIGGNNDLIPGIAEVSSRLAVQPDGLPRLFVAPSCVHTIMEFEQYRYPEGKEKTKGAGETPIKAFDHAMDALRYVAMGLRETGPLLLW